MSDVEGFLEKFLPAQERDDVVPDALRESDLGALFNRRDAAARLFRDEEFSEAPGNRVKYTEKRE